MPCTAKEKPLPPLNYVWSASFKCVPKDNIKIEHKRFKLQQQTKNFEKLNKAAIKDVRENFLKRKQEEEKAIAKRTYGKHGNDKQKVSRKPASDATTCKRDGNPCEIQIAHEPQIICDEIYTNYPQFAPDMTGSNCCIFVPGTNFENYESIPSQ